jgi:hypothetical protein
MTISSPIRSLRPAVALWPSLLLCLTAACGLPGDNAALAQPPARDTTIRDIRARKIPTSLSRDLREASAAVMRPGSPGLLWTINDSGNDPVVFAIDTNGTQVGRWRVEGARNIDWEAAASGPCRANNPAHCLYIGDVGDNSAIRRVVTVYRVDAPAIEGPSLVAETLTFRYADGAHDVEAMYVMPNGTMYFITKRPLKDPGGRLRPALVFSLPASAWDADSVVTAELVDSLSLVPGTGPIRMITDAALAPDGRHLAVRTYTELWLYAMDPESGRVRPDVRPTICDLSQLEERQGEAVTWLDATGRLLLMSEGQRAPLWEIECPTPLRRGT